MTKAANKISATETVFGIPLMNAQELSKHLELGKLGAKAYDALPSHLQHVEGKTYYLNYLSLRAWCKEAARLAPKSKDAIKELMTELLGRFEPVVEDLYDVNIMLMQTDDGMEAAVPIETLKLVSPDVRCRSLAPHSGWATLENACAAVVDFNPVFAKFLSEVGEVTSSRKYRAMVNQYRQTAELAEQYATAMISRSKAKRKATAPA
jgi:hypothetical protein